MRIAIVGSGVAGLAVAWHLRATHDITLLESSATPGGHVHTVQVDDPLGPLAVDMGFIVFNRRTYPGFCAWLAELGIEARPSTMSFSVRDDASGREWNGGSLGGLFVQRSHLLSPRFLGFVRDILRFGRNVKRWHAREASDLSLGEFLSRGRYGARFREEYLVPLVASIWSAPPGSVESFPMRFLAGFLVNHGMLDVFGRPPWLTVSGGSRSYVQRVLERCGERVRLRTSTKVRSVARQSDGVELELGDGTRERFDEVVLACHADQALGLLREPTPRERELLSAFPYQENLALLHTDTRLLPRKRAAWAAWNYRVESSRESDRACVTYDMNILQGLRSSAELLVSLNGEELVDPKQVLQRVLFSHPQYGLRSHAAQARHAELIRHQRVSACGAYWGYGFHEDGYQSGLRVARAFAS
ncbi:MAG: FAD-dependent oxidoreductase [Planctomycetes bacterium]|nr:FAD-dependent oxidoreductase [Planctomycetota bacterium]